jgi:homoserine O-acetyltransferase
MAKRIIYWLTSVSLVLLFCFKATAQPTVLTPQEGNWLAPEFTFHNGQTLKNLRIHYYTLGDSKNPTILLLHGTNQPIKAFLANSFAGELFGPGQALDISKYFIVIPESIGSGKSSKPSDTLRMAFPQYDYSDMVVAQYRLLNEGLAIKHLRLVMGYSMGGMQTWLWGEKYPQMMDALVPMASQPTELSGRNWMLRRMLVESIKHDPAWDNGNYTSQPPALQTANIMFSIATTGGTLAYQNKAPTRALADRLVDERLAAPTTLDANDVIYIWSAAADYNASPQLEAIQAPLLAINSADDERNPVETAIMPKELKRVKHARLLIIPTSEQTSGHGTMMTAELYKDKLAQFMKETANHKR